MGAVTVLEVGADRRGYWREVWCHRELFFVLAWRDVAVRYKQTVIGIAWALVRPLIAVAAFSVVFGEIAGLKSEGETPYPLLVYAGMLAWFLFSSILSDASASLVTNGHLVSKVYFPRIILPGAAGVVALADFSLNLAVFMILLWCFGVVPGLQVLALPFFVVLAILAAMGPGLFMAAWNVRYRDFRYVVPFVVQIGLYISPVGFSSAVVPDGWRIWLNLNPMAGVIDGFRWCLLGGDNVVNWAGLVLNIIMIATLLWFGHRTFRRMARTMADDV